MANNRIVAPDAISADEAGAAPDALPGTAPAPAASRDAGRRVVIEGVRPEIDAGRFPIKRPLGEAVVVEADVFADGHDELAAELRYRPAGERTWTDIPMAFVENDRWRGSFVVEQLGLYEYTLRAWVDAFATWRRDLRKKVDAGQDVAVDLLAGAELVGEAARRARGPDRRALSAHARKITSGAAPAEAVDAALSEDLAEMAGLYPDRRRAAAYDRELQVVVDPERARFSAWYELFPRSASGEPGRHGTFADVEARLPYVAEMGFNVLYLPPIHPIGRAHRKGPNNNPKSKPGDPGSPWAIGSEEGGHDAIHPELGTVADFERLVRRAREDHGVEVALDLAFQCSPDHPWVRDHPEWFRHRADGTIQHAENPPKKYEDIYPIDFETEGWRELWAELRRVVEVWISRGVRIFRVDNPHTKPFRFWEWLIGEVKAEHPDVIFLSEAFTRPKVMYRLAKLGFTQSYTYFAWRNTKAELTEYLTEVTQTEVAEYFRPNLWPNTPDILTEQLQTGGRAMFVQRLVLAATLGASYGIYGPPFELQEHRPMAPGREEYLHSEKYEVREWNLDRADSLAELIARVNRIRRENAALHSNRGLRFHGIENEHLIAYSKSTDDLRNVILVIVNLDPGHPQSGWTQLWLDDLGVDRDGPFQVHDLLTGSKFLWQGSGNFVDIDPSIVPAHIFRISGKVRTERDFETYL